MCLLQATVCFHYLHNTHIGSIGVFIGNSTAQYMKLSEFCVFMCFCPHFDAVRIAVNGRGMCSCRNLKPKSIASIKLIIESTLSLPTEPP